MLLLISSILFFVSVYFAFTFPAVYRHLEESSRFYIGFKKGAGDLNRNLRASYTTMRMISLALLLITTSWLAYLLVLEFSG